MQNSRQRVARPRKPPNTSLGLSMLAALLVGVALGSLLALVSMAKGSDIEGYKQPDLGAYYTSLKQPDAPSVGCCGVGDAYFADKTDACRPNEGANCALVAIITDTRPNTFKLDDGSEMTRTPIAPGERFAIPRNKLRVPASENPTEHNIIFIGVHDAGTYVYCWEPVAGL
jgi:hypothetical protein